MNTTEREQSKNKHEEEKFAEFTRLMYRTAALPQQAREKVAAYTQGILAVTESKGA